MFGIKTDNFSSAIMYFLPSLIQQENGLRVLLCSDPTSTSAAAAMDVHVGACADPDEVPVG